MQPLGHHAAANCERVQLIGALAEPPQDCKDSAGWSPAFKKNGGSEDVEVVNALNNRLRTTQHTVSVYVEPKG